MKYVKIFTVLFILFLISCRTNVSDELNIYQILVDSPDAAVYIADQLQKHKIVLISEKHSDVSPDLFLTEHLAAFYNAGMRYLFLESRLPSLPEDPDYGFFMFYPWENAGWKYEWLLLAREIADLNNRLAPVNSCM